MIAAAATWVGCASRPHATAARPISAVTIEEIDIAQIVPGRTTLSEIVARFGKPHHVLGGASGLSVVDYPFQRQTWEPGRFADTQAYSANGFVMQSRRVPQWESGRWTHESKQLRVTIGSDNVVEDVEVRD